MAGIERLLKRRVERRVIAGFEAGRPGVHKPEPDDRPSSAAAAGALGRVRARPRPAVRLWHRWAGKGADNRTSAEPDGNRATPRTHRINLATASPSVVQALPAPAARTFLVGFSNVWQLVRGR
jgi:hypothetical protein